MNRSKKELLDEIQDLDKETFDLIAKVIELINVIGWDPDDTYTFKDGDRWARFDPEYEILKAKGVNDE